jgi:hypothetical protein
MATWQFRPLNPNDNSGISTVDDNFANEERSSVEILVRETLQNPLDARHEDELVEVRYDIVTVKRDQSAFLSAIFSSEAISHFQSGHLLKTEKLPDEVTFLVVEDFGTSGLEGVYTDSSIDGRTQNWNAFWFREGEGAKPTKSNGGAGQGKITLYAASQIRSVMALTKRRSDQQELLFGCCRFKQNYKIDGRHERWAKEARWGAVSDPQLLATPLVEHELIDRVKTELNLARENRPGTTFIVPMPDGITLSAIRKAVIDEFFFPIRRGRLRVILGNEQLDQSTVAEAAKSLGENTRFTPAYRLFLEDAIDSHIAVPATASAISGWAATTKLTEACFGAAELSDIRKKFEESKSISVDFPVKVKRKNAISVAGKFRVILQQELNAEQSQELFVRQDLGIDGERRLRGSRRIQPVLALTFIDDLELSAFLTAAEEPTHRTWNASRPKVKLEYDGTVPLLNAVRNAALRLVDLLTPPGRRDNTALALYFADPSTAQPTARRGPDGKDNLLPPAAPGAPTIEIPPAKPKPIQFLSREDGFCIKAIPVEMATKRFPVFVEIVTAYATTLGDAFKQWDAADFWLNDEKCFPVEIHGIENIVRDGNRIRFIINQVDANFSIAGFDVNRKVEVQINYREHEDAENFKNH